ncbi:TlpA family protein disulfide reductase [Marinimicrobium locisalis]|uniref:TlpA family protein disulfide reductase n=1 Tax=Marinimicrobium locisalis TaxID=546022 RepID=UPI003222076E
MKRFSQSLTTMVFGLFLAASTQALETGEDAPPFSLPGIENAAEGQAIALEQYQGKVVYVDFWASWCGPCRRSFPKLEALHQKYGEQGFEVIAINLDEQEADAHKFLDEHPVSFPIAWDPEGKVAGEYQLKGMPSAFLLDRDGTVHHVVVGFNEKDAAAIEAAINQLTKE